MHGERRTSRSSSTNLQGTGKWTKSAVSCGMAAIGLPLRTTGKRSPVHRFGSMPKNAGTSIAFPSRWSVHCQMAL